MTGIALADILELDRYEGVRAEYRTRVLAHKRDRRVAVGEKVTMLFEDRYKRFIPEGGAHTTLLTGTSDGGEPGLEIGALDTEIDGVTVLDWFTAHIEGTSDWDDLVAEGLE